MSTAKKIEEKKPPTKQEIQQEIERHFRRIKSTLKHNSKSSLIKMLWNQGVEYRNMQQVAQELYEENVSLKKQLNPEPVQQTEEGPE
jgi:fumarate hydratase class II